MLRIASIAFLACLWAAAPVVALFGLSGIENQQPLHSTNSPQSSNYSVGFNLASSYGAAAVIIDNADGEKEILTWVVHGDLACRYWGRNPFLFYIVSGISPMTLSHFSWNILH
jgi:hypothetical protein